MSTPNATEAAHSRARPDAGPRASHLPVPKTRKTTLQGELKAGEAAMSNPELKFETLQVGGCLLCRACAQRSALAPGQSNRVVPSNPRRPAPGKSRVTFGHVRGLFMWQLQLSQQ